MHYPGLVHGTQIRNAVSGHGTFSTVTSSQPPTLSAAAEALPQLQGWGFPSSVVPSCGAGCLLPKQAQNLGHSRPSGWEGRAPHCCTRTSALS